MKDSIKLMQIYRYYLETTGKLVELLESHCINVQEETISEELKNKYNEFRKHSQKLIENLNDDLHILFRIDKELKDIEDEEETKKTN